MKTGKIEIQWNQNSYDGYILTTMLFPWHRDGQTEGFGSKEELLKLFSEALPDNPSGIWQSHSRTNHEGGN